MPVPERQQNQGFFFPSFLVSVFFVSILPPVVGVVPVAAAVAVVGVVAVVPDVSDMVVPVVYVVSVVAIVLAVSVAMVDDVVVEVMPVSVAAVSVFAFSCFLQPTAKIATATSTMRVITRDFFIGKFSSKFVDRGKNHVGAVM
jgi:hypothetical protein